MTSWRDTVAFIGRSAKRIAVAVGGGTLVLLGVVMMPLPGPGLLIVALGLGVLATEFVWAQLALDTGKRTATKILAMAKSMRTRFARR